MPSGLDFCILLKPMLVVILQVRNRRQDRDRNCYVHVIQLYDSNSQASFACVHLPPHLYCHNRSMCSPGKILQCAATYKGHTASVDKYRCQYVRQLHIITQFQAYTFTFLLSMFYEEALANDIQYSLP